MVTSETRREILDRLDRIERKVDALLESGAAYDPAPHQKDGEAEPVKPDET